MTIVKINVHKVSASRNLSAKVGQVKINNNVSLSNVEELSFSADGKKGLKFTFTFSCTYEPDLGKIEVEGQVMWVDEAKTVDEVKASWDKDKRIPMNVMEPIINASLHKGNIQAIKISEDIDLPSPLPLPKVKPTEMPVKESKKK
ncbi:MAG: hypothetical protein ABIH82_03710 [Candidatus Woesearchaeota archaeon]